MEIDVDGQNGDLRIAVASFCRDLLSNPVIEDYEPQKAGWNEEEKTKRRATR